MGAFWGAPSEVPGEYGRNAGVRRRRRGASPQYSRGTSGGAPAVFAWHLWGTSGGGC